MKRCEVKTKTDFHFARPDRLRENDAHMNIADTNAHFAMLARQKSNTLKSNPLGVFIASMLAGAYVGVGIILIVSVGEHAGADARTLIMGASFGVALTLVVFAGAELFTGYTMYMPQGLLAKHVNLGDLAASWAFVWVGNLIGCAVLAAICVLGAIDIVSERGELLYDLAAKKMNMDPAQMIARGMLCNWLVCLALWASARTANDAAKILIIFWCLFAFIASGFEHSVANMTVFALALFSEHPDNLTYMGAARNLLWVTIGNTISGCVFVAGAYWLIGGNGAAVAGDRLYANNMKEEDPCNP